MKITKDIIKHIDHLEDFILYGSDGISVMETFLETLFDYLNGIGEANIKIKIDGSPAVVASTDFHGGMFVALKHSWDKGKRFYIAEEIEEEYGDRPDLAEKLKLLLANLPYINIPKDNIWMGDFLFDTRKDCIIWNFPGQGHLDCVSFRPNTVIYTYPLLTKTANQILSSSIGIAWHTRYVEKDSVFVKSNDISLDEVNSTPTVFQMVTDMPALSSFLSDDQNIVIQQLLSKVYRICASLENDPNFNDILQSKTLVQRLLKFKNDNIKEYHTESGEAYTAEEFKKVVLDETEKHIEELKSDRSKEQNRAKKKDLETLLDRSTEALNNYFEVQSAVTSIKNIFIDVLNSSLGMNMYYEKNVKDKKSMLPCKGEGYVITDDEGNVAKLVNRLDFSLANFDDDIVKGWER